MATKSLYPFVLLVAFSSIYEIVFIYYFNFDSNIWSKIYLILEFIALLLVFTKNSENSFKYTSFFFSVVFFSFYVYFVAINTELHTLKTDGILSIIEFFYIIAFSIRWFISVFKRFQVETIVVLPMFYFISGLLIYYSGTIFLFLLSEEILNAGLSLVDYWVVNIVLVLIFRILLIISIWKGRTK